MLADTIPDVVAELQALPENQDLPLQFWLDLRLELSDLRRWYIGGVQIDDPSRDLVLGDAQDCIARFRNSGTLVP